MKTYSSFSKMFIFLSFSLLVIQCKKDEEEEKIIPPVVKQEDIQAVDSIAQKWMTQFNMPGLSLAVSNNGKLVYAKGYGFADKETNTPVTTSSQFRIASVSKLFTSVAIMKLIDEGKITMEHKVFGSTGILGTKFGTLPYKTYVEDITVSDLLHHTIGGWGQNPTDPSFIDNNLTKEGVIDWTIDHLNLTSAPGTSFAYSNFGYMLLSEIIEEVTGKDYEFFLSSEIFNSIGAKNTFIAGDLLSDRVEKEVKYYGQSINETNSIYQMKLGRSDGAMGLLSTPSDMLRLATAVDSSNTRPDILKLSTIKTMVTTTPASKGFGFNFGCGWVVEGNEWFWWGTLPGTFAILYRNGNGICIAATANSRSTNDVNSLNSFIGVLNYISFEDIKWQDINQFN